MSQTAAHLVDHVIPHVPARQWVPSSPIALRLLLASQSQRVTPVLQVVQRVPTRHSLDRAAAAARTLGVVDQTLFNWVKAHRAGKLTGADSKVVSAEQMEISRLRAELARVKMERDILGKATAYFAKAVK